MQRPWYFSLNFYPISEHLTNDVFAGAGLGMRPTTNTGNGLIDSIVWVKPPGESDGTSVTTAARYDTRQFPF